MILVTFALPFESAGFRRTRAAGAGAVTIVHTGMGIESARAAVAAAIAECRPDLVVSSGFAGGLDPSLTVGDMLVEGLDLPGFRRGAFATVDDVLVMAGEKASLREGTGADAVDMESAGIRSACMETGVPFVIARAVSDRAGDDLGLPPDMLRNLATRPHTAAASVAWLLLTKAKPRRAFLRMFRDSRTAQRALADALPRLLLLLEKRDPVGG